MTDFRTADVVDIGQAREQREQEHVAEVGAAERLLQLEDTALILAAALALMVTGPDKDDSSRESTQHAYNALRGTLEKLRQVGGCPHWTIPELLDDRLCCIEASDDCADAFRRLANQYYDGDTGCALRLVKRLRRLDPSLGLPVHNCAERWTPQERGTVLSWLRLLEHAHEATTVTGQWDLQAV